MSLKPNYKLLGILVVGVVATAIGVDLLHRLQVRRTAGILLSRAEEKGREGKVSEEVDLLNRYLAYRPEDTDALEKFGLALAQDASPAGRVQALESLERVLTRDAGRSSARIKAADLAMKLGQFDAAKVHYGYLESATPGGSYDAEEALGRCEEQLKDYPKAQVWLTKAIDHDPSKVEAQARLARLLRISLKDPEKADRLMDARETKGGVVSKNPKSARAYLERASYRREFAIPGAGDDLKQALVLAPEDAEVLLEVAGAAPLDEALRLLGKGIESHPGDSRFYERKAMVEAGAGRREEALAVLNLGVEKFSENRNLRWLRAEITIDLGKRAEAVAEIDRLRKMGFPGPPLDFLESRLLADDRDWTGAARRLATIAPTLASLPGGSTLAKRAFLILARCHAQLGNPEMRYNSARRSTSIEVDDASLSLNARVELASALAGLGKLDEAAEEYRAALRSPVAPARLHVELARVAVAKSLRVPRSNRRWDEVERLLNEADAALPNSTDLAILRAEVLSAQDQLDPAKKRLQQAQAAHPDDSAIAVALAALAIRQGRADEALSTLVDARKKFGDRPELLASMVQYWSARPGEASVKALRDLAESAGKVADESVRRALLTSLAEALERQGERSRSTSILDALVKEQPDNLAIRLAQLDASFEAGDLSLAGKILDEVRRLEGPEGTLWRFGRAQWLIRNPRKPNDRKPLDEARALLAEVRQRRPTWARAAFLSAELDDERQDFGSALKGYLAAIENGENDPVAIRRAVQLLSGQGRFAEADALLGQVQQEGPLSPELGRLAAEVALQLKDDDRAMNMARKLAASRPDSAVDQTWLGQWLVAASKKAEDRGQASDANSRRIEAEKALRRGAELAPNDPDSQVALVLSLAAWGREADANEAIRRAESSLNGPAREMALARCLESVGRSGDAETKYRAILQARPDDIPALHASAVATLRRGQVSEAEPLLRRLIDLRDQSPGEAAWARRVLALAFSAEGGVGSIKARKLLGLDEDTATTEGTADPSADDLRARVQVLVRQPGRAARRKALSLIEKLIARDEARPTDLFVKAQLLSLDGDWNRARGVARQILGANPASPVLVDFLARGEIASGNPDQAMPWIKELARLRPQLPSITELNARVAFAKGKSAEAVAMLEDFARKDPTRGAAVAGLLEEFHQVIPAEALLRRLEKDVEDRQAKVEFNLALVGLQGRRERHSEAIALCEKLWADPSVSASKVSSAAIVALYVGHPDPAILLRVEKGIADALARKPDDIVLQFDSANLAILRERYADAESKLRDIQKAKPDIGAPLNNLAWLMAVRGRAGPESLDLIDRAIALDGPSPGLLDTRGLVLTLVGQADRAIDDLAEAIAADPSANNYFHLALALRKAGKPAEAAEALDKARSSGLRPGDIHPLERSAYLELVAAYPAK